MTDTVDVEACAGVLTELTANADFYRLHPRTVALLSALASALPGMGKDSERLDTLESWTKGDQTICPPGNHGGEDKHWLLARDDDAKGDRYGIWSETTEGPTLREAVDAARAAQPQETSDDAE